MENPTAILAELLDDTEWFCIGIELVTERVYCLPIDNVELHKEIGIYLECQEIIRGT